MSNVREIFFTIDGSEKQEVLEISEKCCVGDVIDEAAKKCGIKDTGSLRTYCDDRDEPLSNETPVIDMPDGSRVHIGQCESIDVKIYYSAQTQSRKVSPAVKIGTLRKDAIKHFKPEDSKDQTYILIIMPNEKQPSDSLSVGAVVESGSCSIGFNLAPSKRHQG